MSVVLGLVLVQAAAVAVKPSGKWEVSYEDSMCILSRSYGPARVAFKPVIFGEVADVILVTDDGNREYRLGRGRVVIQPGGAVIEARVRSWKADKQSKRVVALEVPRASLPQIAAANVLAISADRQNITIAQSGGIKAFAALNTCEENLIVSMEPSSRSADLVETADPTGRDTVQAHGSPAYWLTADDYPMEAVRQRLQGTTYARWIIGTDGRVKHCMITGRSDHPALDEIVCQALRERGRYRPATGPDGRPVETTASRRVVWKLPN